MKRALPEAVVEFLGFSHEGCAKVDALRGFTLPEWNNCLRWLHDAGIALYFLHRLKSTSNSAIVPKSVVHSLEHCFQANRRRTSYLADRFRAINQQFEETGVRYAVVKGFSLVPQFCPEMELRLLSDLDYLVDPESLPAAREVIERAGYLFRSSTPTHFAFINRQTTKRPEPHEQYDAGTPHAVELHLSLWETETYGSSLAEPKFLTGEVENQTWQGCLFPALAEEDVFLLQCIHAFGHILTYWIRMSWLYEISYFLNRQATDEVFWVRVKNRVGSDPVLREVIALVVALATQFFSAPVPPLIADWIGEIRPAVRVWIEHYARTWAFGKNHHGGEFVFFPTAKLVLFLHQQYTPDKDPIFPKRLVPLGGFSRLLSKRDSVPQTVPGSGLPSRRHLLRKTLFHVGSGVRYVWEVPRWHRLNRTILKQA